ncbi:peptide-methionine (S)-S-oxide reductase MsrA [Paludibacterium paludis]|uniref:Peptide methionine sulfoxide reductase MsrA n=1 Tax=Paludibacterium paludis TaxID=1225769 RepID=A0A918U9E7_9NEIS|nr:peptide-methionine (S)-S-oxide reductase MsrA [Paludibacterium paludis]GGY13253.1 peptide methionine sulfoxide reductase MsrA [Paludibacterium paludis]
MEKAILGGGCFWCLDTIFRRLKGVESVVSGYTGGHATDPDYRSVCEGLTGHAEVVEIMYDPSQIRYADLLEIFFAIHDPTTLNRQGYDTGTQYRSSIFTTDAAQEAEARHYVAQLEAKKIFDAPIVTQISPAGSFYPAEEEHQDYFERHGSAPYCRIVIAPKVRKFLEIFQNKLKS